MGEILPPKRFNGLNQNSKISGSIVCRRNSQKNKSKKFRVQFSLIKYIRYGYFYNRPCSVFVKVMCFFFFFQFVSNVWIFNLFLRRHVLLSTSCLFCSFKQSVLCHPCSICHWISIVVPSLRSKDKTRLCPFLQARVSE